MLINKKEIKPYLKLPLINTIEIAKILLFIYQGKNIDEDIKNSLTILNNVNYNILHDYVEKFDNGDTFTKNLSKNKISFIIDNNRDKIIELIMKTFEKEFKGEEDLLDMV